MGVLVGFIISTIISIGFMAIAYTDKEIRFSFFSGIFATLALMCLLALINILIRA